MVYDYGMDGYEYPPPLYDRIRVKRENMVSLHVLPFIMPLNTQVLASSTGA